VDHAIELTERRRRELPAAEWRHLMGLEEFWRLADAGYVSGHRSGSGRFELAAHAHVGRARLGGIELTVREKVPGTLAALVSAATGAELKIEHAESPATEFDLVSRHLMGEFIDAAGNYIAHRRRPRNRYREAVGPALAGSLDMAATMRLHAGGRRGLFAFDRGEVVRDEPLDRLVLAGLDEIDRSGDALALEPVVLHDARWLAGALEEVRDRRFLDTPRDGFLDLADDVAVDPAMLPADADLARLASVALLHRGFEPQAPIDEERVPRAWFVNLETLFERAVREALRELLPRREVDRGEAFPRRMFSGGEDASRTNPDLVVHGEGTVGAVGDVKYKSLSITGPSGEDREGKQHRDDLYQLLVHTASLECERAFLVYASEGDCACRYLGRAATGCLTWVAQVRPAFLGEDLARLLDELGLAEPAETGET
jgi:hypothetical protein